MSQPVLSLSLRSDSRRQIAFIVLTALAASLTLLSAPRVVAPSFPSLSSEASRASEARAAEGYGDLPISFEPNVGQAADRYDFVARGRGFAMTIDAAGATLALGAKTSHETIRLEILGADASAAPRALEALDGKVNYFIGSDSSKWRRGIPTYGRVSYDEVLSGIGVTYYGTNEGTFEYDFEVAPGADPHDIRIGFSGADGMELRNGSLVIRTASGAIKQEAPVLYQTIAGRRVSVAGRYSLVGDEVGFEVGSYDPHRPLVIDPTLAYSSYLGGQGIEVGWGIAVDTVGRAFLTGYTTSVNPGSWIPVLANQSSSGGSYDAYVTKLTPAGAIAYSTYLGGSVDDFGYGIATDGAQSAFITGATSSTNFPTTGNAYLATQPGGIDAFVTKLDFLGGLEYSTYLGGPMGGSSGGAIAVDGSGDAYVSGHTGAADFPTTTGASQGTFGGNADVFVTKLNNTGSALLYSTYLGGSDEEDSNGIALDATGAAYVSGYTYSTDFPAHASGGLSPYQASNSGGQDGFVAKFDAGGARVYSTYLGKAADDRAITIAVDSSKAAYVTGETESTNFPTLGGFQGNSAMMDGFVTKLNPTGSALVYSTYLGGSNVDGGSAIVVDANNAAYVAGWTHSPSFQGAAPSMPYKANGDAFVAKLAPNGASLAYFTFLGGMQLDASQRIALDGHNAAYVVGWTQSYDFPMQVPFQASHGGGGSDGFVVKLTGNPPPLCGGLTVTLQVTVQGPATYGTSGVDVIRGTPGSDVIFGLGGNDTICGLRSADHLYGEGGNDTLYGNAATDVLKGNAGADHLYGMGGGDSITGDAGGDVVRGGPGPDAGTGDQGSDLLLGEQGNDTLKGGSNPDFVNGGANYDMCDGGVGPGDGKQSCEVHSNFP